MYADSEELLRIFPPVSDKAIPPFSYVYPVEGHGNDEFVAKGRLYIGMLSIQLQDLYGIFSQVPSLNGFASQV